jgi:hypothetical protein
METWKPVVGYEELYFISSKGNIKSIINSEIVDIVKQYWDIKRNKYYWYAVLYNNLGKKEKISIHSLMANAFIPKPENYQLVKNNKLIIKFINGDADDLRIDNIKWEYMKKTITPTIPIPTIPISNMPVSNTTISITDIKPEVKKPIDVDITFLDLFYTSFIKFNKDELVKIILLILEEYDKERLLNNLNEFWLEQPMNIRINVINKLKNIVDNLPADNKPVDNNCIINIEKQFESNELNKQIELMVKNYLDPDIIESIKIFADKNVNIETIAKIYKLDVDIIKNIIES